MPLNGILHLSLLDADVPLGYGSAAVLEELLHQSDVVMTVFINLRGIILAETVGADPRIPQIVTHRFQMPLDRSLRHWENPLLLRDAVVQAVAPDELIEGQRNGEHPGLPGFLLRDSQAVALPVLDDIGEAEF